MCLKGLVKNMNYIWDTVIKAEKLGIDEKQIRFVLAKEYSPYMEMSFLSLNELLQNEDITREIAVEVNPYYRFHEIFKNMFTLEYDEDRGLKEELFDWLVHLLVKVDVNHGMNLREFLKRFIEEEILDKDFGEDMKEYWSSFDREQKEFISSKIVELYHLGRPIHTLKEVVAYVFHDSYVYTNNIDKAELLIYAGKRQKEVYEKQMNFIIKMFLPLEYSHRIYWSNHFGIIGMDETMCVNKIALY